MTLLFTALHFQDDFREFMLTLACFSVAEGLLVKVINLNMEEKGNDVYFY